MRTPYPSGFFTGTVQVAILPRPMEVSILRTFPSRLFYELAPLPSAAFFFLFHSFKNKTVVERERRKLVRTDAMRTQASNGSRVLKRDRLWKSRRADDARVTRCGARSPQHFPEMS